MNHELVPQLLIGQVLLELDPNRLDVFFDLRGHKLLRDLKSIAAAARAERRTGESG